MASGALRLGQASSSEEVGKRGSPSRQLPACSRLDQREAPSSVLWDPGPLWLHVPSLHSAGLGLLVSPLNLFLISEHPPVSSS